MYQAKMWFAVFVFSAAMLNAPASSPAAGPRGKRIPLDLYTSEACNEKGVINNDGKERYDTWGTQHLAEGVHAVTLTYFYISPGDYYLRIEMLLAAGEVAGRHVMAEALLAMGKQEKAREILMDLSWSWQCPIDDKTQLRLTSDLRRFHRWAKGHGSDTDAAMASVNTWLRNHPMLRTVPGVIVAKIEARAATGDYARTSTLAKQARGMDMNDRQRRELMLMQVKSMVKAGKMDAARDIYLELKKIAPYSEATTEAREAIKEAVIGK